MEQLFLSHPSQPSESTIHSSQSSEPTLSLANMVILKAIYKGSNVVMSPLSFQAVLCFMALGCEGKTKQQLLQFLGSKDDADLQSLCKKMVSVTSPSQNSNFGNSGPTLEPQELRFANALYLQEDFSFQPSFLERVQALFKAESIGLNPGHKFDDILREINAWAARVSKGLITEILNKNSLSGMRTALILSNGIYFKGKWAEKFDVSRTQKKNFYLLNGGHVSTQFMTTKKKSHYFRQFDGFKVLSLQYKKNGQDPRRFAMYIFLPDQKNGLQSFIQGLNDQPSLLTDCNLCLWMVNLSQIWIPKFKFSFDLEATEDLKEMGLQLLFQAGNQDFNGMVISHKGETIHLSKVFHKAFIEVDEDGTEAVAFTTTACVGFGSSLIRPPPPPKFVADHPFFFMIRETTTKTIFFSGAVVNPLLT